jgi:hypothetical protein
MTDEELRLQYPLSTPWPIIYRSRGYRNGGGINTGVYLAILVSEMPPTGGFSSPPQTPHTSWDIYTSRYPTPMAPLDPHSCCCRITGNARVIMMVIIMSPSVLFSPCTAHAAMKTHRNVYEYDDR